MQVEYSAGGIVLWSGKVVLVFQRRTQTWSFPKGHIECGENDLEAATREIFEETGILTLELLQKLGEYERKTLREVGVVKHITMFLFRADMGGDGPTLGDIEKCKWVGLDEVSQVLSYQEDVEFFRSVQHLLFKEA